MAAGKKDPGTQSADATSDSEQTVLSDDPQNPRNEVPHFEQPDVAGGDLPGAAQATQAELDAEEDKARTTYVLLFLHESVVDPESDHTPVSAWEEFGRIRAASRAAAWEEAKRRYPQVKPTTPGEQTSCQLVPKRFFQTITARAKPPLEPELEVEGL